MEDYSTSRDATSSHPVNKGFISGALLVIQGNSPFGHSVHSVQNVS